MENFLKRQTLAAVTIAVSIMLFVAGFALIDSQPAYAHCDDPGTPPEKNCIVHDINLITRFLSGLAGLVIVGTLILGGIQYAAAGDSPEAISKAKKRIINGLIALFVFVFMVAILEWLIPGNLL